MAKHTYSVTINRIPASRDLIEYQYRSTACTLTCSRDAASVRYASGVLKTFDDLISFRVDLVKDAMRKMYLLHAMRFSTRLKVRKIIVTIDGESQDYDENSPGFPFLHSMLTAKELALPESWKDRSFQESVLTLTKSASDSDPRYACLFSFLSGSSRVYESEKFTCYWTAVNAHYNYLLKCFKGAYARKQGYARYEAIPKQDFEKNGKKRQGGKNLKALRDGDAYGLSALILHYGCGDGLRPSAERRRPTGLSEEEARERNFLPQYGALKGLLRSYSQEELPRLYRQLYDHRTDRTWVPEGPLGEHLKLCTKRAHMSAWSFLVFEYAYYIRCNYLHGSKAAALFASANDPDIAAFRALNCFLSEYLKEVIPQMFREDWFTEEMYEAAMRAQQN